MSKSSIRERSGSIARGSDQTDPFPGRVRSYAIQSSASLIRGTALTVSIDDGVSGQRGFMYAPKMARLSRSGISWGRFLWSAFVATDAPIHGQLAIVPTTLATAGPCLVAGQSHDRLP